jgi:hypothetical protein
LAVTPAGIEAAKVRTSIRAGRPAPEASPATSEITEAGAERSSNSPRDMDRLTCVEFELGYSAHAVDLRQRDRHKLHRTLQEIA